MVTNFREKQHDVDTLSNTLIFDVSAQYQISEQPCKQLAIITLLITSYNSINYSNA